MLDAASLAGALRGIASRSAPTAGQPTKFAGGLMGGVMRSVLMAGRGDGAAADAGAAPPPVSGPAPSWQAERVAAMRQRFSRPGVASLMPKVQPMQRAPMPVAEKPAPVQAVSPSASDMQAYMDAWNRDVGGGGPG